MKLRKPSPAMAVACVALFVSLGGTSVAAINFARNAGAVDGRSAVKAAAGLEKAAGKLVATKRSGPDRGKIPTRFLSVPGRGTSFNSYVPVTDNSTTAGVALATVPGLGQITAVCADQGDRAGVENPVTRLTFTNSSGTGVDFMRQIGNGQAEVVAQPAATVQTFNIPGANRFTLHAQRGLTNMLVEGVVREDGAGTGDAKCLVYGATFRTLAP